MLISCIYSFAFDYFVRLATAFLFSATARLKTCCNSMLFPRNHGSLLLTLGDPVVPLVCSFITRDDGYGKSRRQRRRERYQRKGLMSRTMVLHMRYESLYISLPSSANNNRDLTQNTTATATRTSPSNKSFNEQNNSYARAS